MFNRKLELFAPVCYVWRMSDKQQVIEWVRTLPDDKPMQAILAELHTLTRSQGGSSGESPRLAGLHRGTVWMSDDFNSTLPDEFWLR